MREFDARMSAYREAVEVYLNGWIRDCGTA